MDIALSSKNFSGHTGSARIISKLSRAFTVQGNKVDIVGNTLNKKAVKACGARPVEIVKFPVLKKLSREAYMEKHRRYLQKAGYALCIGNGDEAVQDILLLHNCVNLCHELVHGAPVGDSVVRDVSAIHGKILKNRLFKKMVANSELMKRDISTRYGVPEEMIKVIHPAYDRNIFTPEGRHEAAMDFRDEMEIPASAEFLVGLITSGDFTKRNLKGFMGAVKRLPEDLAAKIHLVVVGKDKLENFISDKPNNLTHISLTGDPAAIMRSLDVMLYPALLEEFGLVVAETAACGTPVLTSRMVGASELFTGLHAEALCDRPDEAHFAAQLERLLSDTPHREAMSAEAASMLGALTWDNYFKEFSELVNDVMRT